MITLGIAMLLGLLGLVVDLGYGYFVKQAAQGAADAAVMAAITSANASRGVCGTSVLCQTGYSCPTSPTNSTDFGVACQYAQSNGFVNSGSQTVTLSSGSGVASTAPGVTSKYWITATVSQQLNLGFLSILGFYNGAAGAQSTAAVFVTPNSDCVYTLDTAASGALTVSGNAALTSGCGIRVNSTSASALSVGGKATLSAPSINVTGGSSINNNATVTPSPTNSASAVTDPLAAIPAPSFAGCDHTSYTISSGTVTLSPGVYCNGITISGQANVTFNSGTYVLNGGGLVSSSSNSILTGNGVMFYNTGSAGYSFAPISLAGGTAVTFSAPTSGTYQGILFFQDRSITSTAQNLISGGVNPNISGTIYMPNGYLTYTGNSANSVTLAIIAKDLTVTGTSNLVKDTTGALTATKTTASLIQ
jgi:hypothetical protein